MALLDTVNLDFHVLSTGDPKILVVMDTSVWGFIEDKPSIIEIILPGSKKVRVYNFIKGKANVFNSSNLLITPVGQYCELVDGIYKITVKGSPDSHCKHRGFLKTDSAKLKLYKMYNSLNLEDGKSDRDKKEKIQDIDLLIKAAEASVSLGKYKKGMQFFKRAVQELNEYNECENC